MQHKSSVVSAIVWQKAIKYEIMFEKLWTWQY